jgi:threonine/homoserine efflux transporter RhtA
MRLSSDLLCAGIAIVGLSSLAGDRHAVVSLICVGVAFAVVGDLLDRVNVNRFLWGQDDAQDS